MLTKEEMLKILEETEALLTGHFQLTSGKHSDRYIQCAKVLQYPDRTALLSEAMAAPFQGKGISCVVGPAMGGIIVAYEVARQLGTRALFTERENGRMTLRRGFTLAPGEKVLVVEDVITSGGSVKEVVDLVQAVGAEVVGVTCLVQRGTGIDLGVPLVPLLSLPIAAYDPADCPLCRQGIPAVKPGSRNLQA